MFLIKLISLLKNCGSLLYQRKKLLPQSVPPTIASTQKARLRLLSHRHEKNPSTGHADGSRYGNGIFHCILGMKERALLHLAHIEPAEVSFRLVLRSKTNSSPNEVP
ncbi:hypothetical protein AVEN_171455-1 [Araneus ventricosus]|uniref:Uncharacterized protein n=1 Tax=Araneus ventricosus TaxID=182803 RepID=A0A4Y2DIW0_ARAVE|nr:hypothetical protein AVEN_171455-1 [Araneus ventricosus]